MDKGGKPRRNRGRRDATAGARGGEERPREKGRGRKPSSGGDGSTLTTLRKDGLQDYHVLEQLGEGSFGKVFKGRRRHSGQTVALKFITKHNKTERDMRNLRSEIEIMRKLDHENVIRMLDAFETPNEFCVVMEYAQGELFQILEDDRALPEEEVRAIAKQ